MYSLPTFYHQHFIVLALVYIEIFFLVINPFSLFFFFWYISKQIGNISILLLNTYECNQSSVFVYRFSSYEVKPTAVKHINLKCVHVCCILANIYAAAAAKSLQSCPTLCDPIDGSPPGSPIPGILQARTLEWGAISFSNG